MRDKQCHSVTYRYRYKRISETSQTKFSVLRAPQVNLVGGCWTQSVLGRQNGAKWINIEPKGYQEGGKSGQNGARVTNISNFLWWESVPKGDQQKQKTTFRKGQYRDVNQNTKYSARFAFNEFMLKDGRCWNPFGNLNRFNVMGKTKQKTIPEEWRTNNGQEKQHVFILFDFLQYLRFWWSRKLMKKWN